MRNVRFYKSSISLAALLMGFMSARNASADDATTCTREWVLERKVAAHWRKCAKPKPPAPKPVVVKAPPPTLVVVETKNDKCQAGVAKAFAFYASNPEKYREAREEFLVALKECGDNAALYFNLAVTETHLGDGNCHDLLKWGPEAKKHFAKAIAMNAALSKDAAKWLSAQTIIMCEKPQQKCDCDDLGDPEAEAKAAINEGEAYEKEWVGHE